MLNRNVIPGIPHVFPRQQSIRVLFITSNWPTPDKPWRAPFVARETRALQEVGVDVDVFVYEGGWSIPNYLRAILEMRRRIRENHYDLIHAYFGECGIVARAQTRLPVVITYAGCDVDGTPNFSGLNRYKHHILTSTKYLSWFVAQVIVVSPNLGKLLPRRDFHVITIALDLDLFQPADIAAARMKLGLPSDKRLVLFAAQPGNSRKRYDLAVEVCKIAGRSFPEGLELVAAVERPPEEVPVYMNACDALLLTSTNEGSPNVVREALACNLPVVSTDVGDVRERIGHLEGCAVCSSDDPQVLADALVRVLQQKTRPVLRDTVLDMNYSALGNQVLAVYKKVLAD